MTQLAFSDAAGADEPRDDSQGLSGGGDVDEADTTDWRSSSSIESGEVAVDATGGATATIADGTCNGRALTNSICRNLGLRGDTTTESAAEGHDSSSNSTDMMASYVLF